VEASIAKATGDENFSAGGTFVRNLAVNSIIGLIPGAPEAKIGTKTAIYATKFAIRTTADTTLDTLQGKGTMTENLQKNAIGNVVGDMAGTLLKKGGSMIVEKAKAMSKEVTNDALGNVSKKATQEIAERTESVFKVGTEKTVTEGTRNIPGVLAENSIKATTATSPSEVFGVLTKFRDEEVAMMKAMYPEFLLRGAPDPSLGIGGASSATWFGNILNERIRRRVEAAIAEGTLTNQLKWTKQGQKGVDFWLPDGTGFDLFTATESALLKHEDRLLDKVAPDGTTTIKDLLPLLYDRK
jgi:hypothetical protein